MIFYIIFAVIVCYFLGNINNALIISKIKKGDIRKAGSGNPGAMNMFRNFGLRFGLLTLVLDGIKGALACIVGWYIIGKFSFDGSILGKYVGAISVIIGHIYPVFLKFKGGKGIASTIGICFVLEPLTAAICLLVGLVFILITQMGAATSFIMISFPLAVNAYHLSANFASNLPCIIIIFAIFLLTFVKHRTNFYRLFAGVENKTDLLKKIKQKRAEKNK